jgi:hypothetical protein
MEIAPDLKNNGSITHMDCGVRIAIWVAELLLSDTLPSLDVSCHRSHVDARGRNSTTSRKNAVNRAQNEAATEVPIVQPSYPVISLVGNACPPSHLLFIHQAFLPQ